MKRTLALLMAVILMLAAGTALADFPLTNEKITLTCFSQSTDRTSPDLSQMIFWDYYEGMTNVHIAVSSVDSTIYKEKLNLLFAGNDIPDIIFAGNVDATFIQQNAEAGMLLPLNDLIGQYAPNLTAIFEERPDWRLDSTLPDGNIYVMPNISMPFRTNTLQVINEKWLEALALSKPTTVEELYDVLVAFRDLDPNGNGLADEIPLIVPSPANLYNTMAWFGLLNGTNFCYEDDGGSVVFTPYTEAFKDWLKFLNKLYAEGLLDVDTFVQTSTQVIAKGSGEDQRVGMSVVNGVTNCVSSEYAYDYGVQPVIAAADGQKIWPGRVQCQAQTRCFIITTACKNPEIAVQWCDYFFTQEGGELIWMGIEDHTYARVDDTYEWLEPYSAEGTSHLQRLEATAATTSIMPDLWLSADPMTNLSGQTNLYRTQFQESGDLKVAFPMVYYSEDVSAELGAYAADVNSYVKEMIAAFVTGTSDIDKQWDTFKSTLRSMQADRMIELMQAAVDARNANE